MNNYPLFYKILGNNLLAGVTNNLIWYALTFWVYLETNSVLMTSWIAGIFALASIAAGFIFGPIVDHKHKWTAMLYSSLLSLTSFGAGTLLFFSQDESTWTNANSPVLWLLIVILMLGVVANNLRVIALSTTVTMLFSEGRDKVNGLVGIVQGVSFGLTSIISGVTIGFFGMGTALLIALIATVTVIIHSLTFTIPEPQLVHLANIPKHVDLRGTYRVVLAIPGLLGLIFFNTFNNLLSGVDDALMDSYGLSLMSVTWWGVFWGTASVIMIASSTYVSRYGVGNHPLRRIMFLNLISWTLCIVFPIQASIPLLIFVMCIWLSLTPMIEAAEQTILQAVVPYERQGRVFGFAQSIESFASPITTLLMGPLAQFIFIPFMTTGTGTALLGDWFGTGSNRGIALIFILAGILGVVATAISWKSYSYRYLTAHYTNL